MIARVYPENIPPELKSLRQWINWKEVKGEDGNTIKVPVNPRTLRNASVSDSATWADFTTALKNVGDRYGIGFVFTSEDPYAGGDSDHCFMEGELDPGVKEKIGQLDTYTEVSTNGNGLHTISKVDHSFSGRKNGKVECYSMGRFFALTGNIFEGRRDINRATAEQFLKVHFGDQATKAHPLRELYAGVDEGARNDTLARLCGSWANDSLSYNECLENAYVWNSKNNPPLDEKEVERTVKSIYEKHHREKNKNPASQLHGTYRGSETVKLKLSTVKDIFSYPDPSFLVEQTLIEKTLTILSAYAGIGKSLLALFIAHAIITGNKLFNHFSVAKRGRVLIVDEENPGSFLKERLASIGFTEDMPLSFLHFQKVKLDNRKCFSELITIIKDLNPTLVIFDSLIRIHDAKENEASEMAQIMERLRDIVNIGVTVLVIHHHRKGAGDRKESVRGSSDILGGIDMHLALEEKGDYLILSSPKSRTRPIDPIRLKLETTEESISFRYLGNELNENQIIIDEVKDILQGGLMLGVKEILDELKGRDYEIGQNRLREVLQGATGRDLTETTGSKGKKLYSCFTASRHIYTPLNCEAEKGSNDNLHSFTHEAELSREAEECYRGCMSTEGQRALCEVRRPCPKSDNRSLEQEAGAMVIGGKGGSSP